VETGNIFVDFFLESLGGLQGVKWRSFEVFSLELKNTLPLLQAGDF